MILSLDGQITKCPVVGLIIWGISVDKGYHWIVGQIAFFLCTYFPIPPYPYFPHPSSAKAQLADQHPPTHAVAAGIQMGNTVITAYIVDSYPLQSMSVITFYSVFLNLSAFINPVRSPPPPFPLPSLSPSLLPSSLYLSPPLPSHINHS